MRRSGRVAVATISVAAVLISGCDGGSPAATPTPPEPTHAPAAWNTDVTWQPCPELPREALAQALPAGTLPGLVHDLIAGLAASVLTAGRSYECATLPVPRDWADPESGETFELALARVRTDAQRDRIGSLVINPGGPGASGVDAAGYLSLIPMVGGLPKEVTDRFDIVGFDPRGVGRSSPVECFTDEVLDTRFGADPDPVADDAFDARVTQIEAHVGACGDAHGDTLRYYSTRQSAHDLDAIRAAVGDEQLNYLGYSYGTLLGAVYAHLYPGNIRAMVLDGAVDPAAGTEGTEAGEAGAEGGQAAGFERAFDNFAQWCQGRGERCPIGPDARSAVTAALEEARDAPVTGPDGRQATAGWVFWAVVSSLYVQELWPQLASAIADLRRGDAAGVFTLADLYSGRDAGGQYPNMFDANTAINCADRADRSTISEIRDSQQSLRDQHPLFGPPLAVMRLDCALWPGEPDPYPYGAARGAPPILVIGTTGDPATPYESTDRLATTLGTGVVLTYEGEGHTVYPQSGCVDDSVNTYLIDQATPEPVTCTS